MPSQVLVSNTPALRDFLEGCSVEGAKDYLDAESLDLDEVYRFVEEHRKIGGDTPKIHELLEGSEVVERKVAPQKELTEIEKLRLKSQERRYQSSIQGAGVRSTDSAIKKSKENPSMGKAMTFATNFATQTVVAFIGAFLFGYFFVETFVAPENFNAKILAGAGCSFLTLMLETVLLVVHEEKENRVAEKRQRVEVKREEREDERDRKMRDEGKVSKKTGDVTEDSAAEPKTAQEKKID